MKKIALLLCFAMPVLAQENQQEYNKLVEELLNAKADIAQMSGSNQFEAVIKKTAGSVSVKASDGKEFKKIEDEGYYPLDPDDTVKTGSDGTAEIYFSNRGMMKLSRNTEIEIGPLEEEDSSVFLKLGALVAKFEKSIKKKLNFKVKTPTAVCAIRGTEFGADYSIFGKKSVFGVYDEGELAVFPIDKDGKEGDEVKVEKGNEIEITPETRRIKVTKMAILGKYRPFLYEIRKKHPLYKKRWRPMERNKREKMRALLLKRKALLDKKENMKRLKKKKTKLNLKKTRQNIKKMI